MLSQVQNYIDHNKLFKPKQRLLIALSSGIDSVACLNVLHRLEYSCGIAHCNFQLRGQESREDAIFARKLADTYGCDFHLEEFDTNAYAKRKRISTQMAARELRYSWFEKIRSDKGYDCIVLAHHADDSIESLLINLCRGTGLRGLTGMQAATGYLRRPLLSCTRSQISEYVQTEKLSYREDSSNLKTDYTRNRIRHNIIPELKVINPSFQQTMLSNMAHFNQEQKVLDKLFSDILDRVIHQQDKEILINLNELQKIAVPEWFLFHYLSGFGFNSYQAREVLENHSNQPGSIYFSTSHQLVVDRENLFLTPLQQKENRNYWVPEGCDSILDPLHLLFKEMDSRNFQIKSDPSIAQLDRDKLQFPLHIRRWKTGDAFYPLGMRNQKKLSDFFIDSKIPRHRKESVWILCSGQDIVWVIGYRIDDRFKINPDTRTILELHLLH